MRNMCISKLIVWFFESRSGLCVSKKEIARLNAIISPLVLQGSQYIKSMWNVKMSSCAAKRLFTTIWMHASLMSGTLICHERSNSVSVIKKPEFKVDKGCHVGRNCQDYFKFKEKNPEHGRSANGFCHRDKGGNAFSQFTSWNPAWCSLSCVT